MAVPEQAATAPSSALPTQAGSASRPLEVRVPAAFTRIFKGPLDWNLFSPLQSQLGNRQIYLVSWRPRAG